jgi:GxxExxY protein
MVELLHQELTRSIIGAYYEVYNHTSRTYPESVYERAMIEEMGKRGHRVTHQVVYRIIYKGQLVGVQQLDLMVLDEVVVENLKTVGKTVGLIFNFGGTKPEFDRLYFDPDRSPPAALPSIGQTPQENWLYPDLTGRIIGGLYEVYAGLGPGFIHRIYANACYRECQMRGLAVQRHKRMELTYKGSTIGDIALGHLSVEGKVMVFPVAYHDKRVIHLDVLRQWMQVCHIRIGILANFQTSRLDLTFIPV